METGKPARPGAGILLTLECGGNAAALDLGWTEEKRSSRRPHSRLGVRGCGEDAADHAKRHPP